MKRISLLLLSAALLAAEAQAARTSLLDLIGVGSRRSSRQRQKAADRSQAQTNAPAAVLTSVAAEAIATPAAVPLAATNALAAPVQAATNAVLRPAPPRETRPAHISSNKVYYDRKEGYAVFTGKVHVDAEDYQMHAQRAYVFFEGTNELKRVVATGGVAITNDTKRAYGAKASYYRKSGMVVLYGDDTSPAEVRDEAKGADQVVRGSKIKFWTTSEQIEILDASIKAPVSGGIGELKEGLMRK